MSGHPEPGVLARAASLPAGERRRLARHAAGCRSCRARLAAEDPSRLFALLALEPVPAERLERLSDRVTASLDREERGTRLRRPLAVAAVAASLLLAGLLAAPLWRLAPGPAPAVLSGSPSAPELLAVDASGQTPGRDLELYLPDQADVLNFTVGEAHVVMIFNEDLEL